MPVKSSLVLVLICFSIHACNAKSLGMVHGNDPAKEFKQSSSSKNNDQNMKQIGSAFLKLDEKYSEPNAPGVAKVAKRFEEKKIDGEYNEPGNYFQEKGDRVKDSSAKKKWRVPHRKRGEKAPGFNLDYSQPKTHPPVHN